MYSVIIPAAGAGSRLGLGYNKLLYKIGGKTIIEHTVDRFLADAHCGQIILTISKSDEIKMKDLFSHLSCLTLVFGGQTRQESIYNGLEYVIHETVLVHDGARPNVPAHAITETYKIAASGHGAIVAVPLKDTVKQLIKPGSSVVKKTIPRESLVIVQTPQAFPTEVLKKANVLAIRAGFEGTDDASLVEQFVEIDVKVVAGDYENVKFTTREDLGYFEYLLKKRET